MTFTDQIGYKFELNFIPKRIVSLVPSQTELLYDLGLDERVIGITKFCIYPKEWFRNKKRVGGTKNLNLDKIADLKPDLIIANKEENTQTQIEALQELYPVYTSDISNLEESLVMIKDVGVITDTKEKSIIITEKIQVEFDRLANNEFKKYTTLYLIWKDPYMSINQNRFISDMMQRCGLSNIITSDLNYPEITKNQINQLKPDLILLSSEPYPFKEKHLKELQNISPNSKIMLVDGEYFSWYGSRLLGASKYFIGLIKKIS